MTKVTEEQRRARFDQLREQFDVDLDDADGWWVRHARRIGRVVLRPGRSPVESRSSRGRW